MSTEFCAQLVDLLLLQVVEVRIDNRLYQATVRLLCQLHAQVEVDVLAPVHQVDEVVGRVEPRRGLVAQLGEVLGGVLRRTGVHNLTLGNDDQVVEHVEHGGVRLVNRGDDGATGVGEVHEELDRLVGREAVEAGCRLYKDCMHRAHLFKMKHEARILLNHFEEGTWYRLEASQTKLRAHRTLHGEVASMSNSHWKSTAAV